MVHSGLHHGSDLAFLENPSSCLPRFPDGDIDHGAAQVVGRNLPDLADENFQSHRILHRHTGQLSFMLSQTVRAGEAR